MRRTTLPLFTALAAIALLGLGGCRSSRKNDLYNVWKERCYELNAKYKQKLEDEVPYHMIADRESERCSSPGEEFRWDADARNLHILIANFLYHYDLEVRGKALDMLQRYRCEREKTCGEIARLLDVHIRASLYGQPKQWRARYHRRARDYYRYLLEASERE